MLVYDPVSGAWQLGLTDGRGGATFTQGVWPVGAELRVGDINGDGRSDIVGYNSQSGHGFVAVSRGTGQFQTVEADWDAARRAVVANLDGPSAEVILYDPATGAWQIRAANRIGLPVVATGSWLPGLTLHVADFNADGVDDVFGYDPDTGQWLIAVTRGLGQFDVQADFWALGWMVATGDLNGDGRADVLLFDPATGIWFKSLTQDPGVFEYWSGTWMPGSVLLGRLR